MERPLRITIVALALIVASLVAVGGSLSGPPRWTPDGLFYHARALELRGADHDAALSTTFQGPLAADLRRLDPERTGDMGWVRFNAQFYERRVAVPAAAAVLEPIAGDRAVLDVSLAGHVAAVLAIFALLLLRFRLAVAGPVALAVAFLPALVDHSSFPQTDSWGLALMTGALISGILALERGPRWLVPWTAALGLLALTRDSTWVPLLAVLWITVTLRSRVAVGLLATAALTTLPIFLLIPVPMRELLAQMLNGAQPVSDPTWSFIIGRYPDAILELVRANGGFVRDGQWYTAAFLLGGLLALFLLTRGARGSMALTMLKAATVAGVAYVLTVPVFSAFRLELVLVPMAAVGVALAVERLLELAPVPRFERKAFVATPRTKI
ncbi:hypothetical protein OJ997_08380 [Solirubrobacter phytolaccae]|uniref:Uncharacterized protein n=1 Tax=Solirubrobacter phytolaccae TaxID=1404360 RepID=A0A9X3N8C8_9ACTN|nr:hypothetical protein [Solirubrobacter phytolaccae]MDA0180309.1 hypothetical protein [Solirubrobacter phytolaccae]